MKELQSEQWTGGELLVCALLELVIVHIAYRIERSKSAPLLSTAAWAIIFGVVFGLILSSISKERARDVGLNPQILFFGLVPPIVLEAGFMTQHRGFFANFWDIFLLGVVGTVLTTIGVGLLLYWLGQTALLTTALSPAEAMLYGSLVSAIDPIATQLVLRQSHVPSLIPELVFGERSINNAISIAVFNLCQLRVQGDGTQVSLANGMLMLVELIGICTGSLVLAAVVGYSSAYLLQRSDDALKQYPSFEVSTLLLFAYASHLAGEYFHLSGHLAVFFSGAFIRHYHMQNISRASATTFKHLCRTLAFLAENFIFIYLGVSVVAYSDTFHWDWCFTLASFGVCLVVRALTTFPLCGIANLWRRRAIPVKYMIVIWFSGLRGAITFALALNVQKQESDPMHAATIRSSAMFTVLCSTIVFTMAMRLLVHCLGLAHTCETHAHARAAAQQRVRGEVTPILTSSDEEEATWIRDAWNDFDQRYLQPRFGDASGRR